MYSFDSSSQYEKSKSKAAVLISEIASSDGMVAAFLNTGVSVLIGSDLSTTIGWDFCGLHEGLVFRLLRLGVSWTYVRVSIFCFSLWLKI